MADEYTGTGSLPQRDVNGNLTHVSEGSDKAVPDGKKRNGFTGELEDAPELLLSASPGDQRKLASPPHTRPLPDLIEEMVNTETTNEGIDLESHVGPSLQNDTIPGTPLATVAQHETPDLNNETEVVVPVEHEDIPAANRRALNEGAVPADLGPYAGQDTTAFNESIEARLDAEREQAELPPIEPPVVGDRDQTIVEPEEAEYSDPGVIHQPWIEPRDVDGEVVSEEEDKEDDTSLPATGNEGTSEGSSEQS